MAIKGAVRLVNLTPSLAADDRDGSPFAHAETTRQLQQRHGAMQTTHFTDSFGSHASLLPPLRVGGWRNRLEVVGIDTSSVSAQVIQLHTLRNRSALTFVHGTMRKGETPVDADNTVPMRTDRTHPFPATGLRVFLVASRIRDMRERGATVAAAVVDIRSISHQIERRSRQRATALAAHMKRVTLPGHFADLLNRSVKRRARSVDALPGFYVPQFYQIGGAQ